MQINNLTWRIKMDQLKTINMAFSAKLNLGNILQNRDDEGDEVKQVLMTDWLAWMFSWCSHFAVPSFWVSI